MRVLFLTNTLDLDDSNLGFAHRWVQEFDKYVDSIRVVAARLGRHALPPGIEVSGLGVESGAGRALALRRFHRIVYQELAHRGCDVIFSHQRERYVILAAPLAMRFGVPIIWWYAHGAVSQQMRLAHALCDRAVTSSPQGFRIPSNKRVVLGQAIDMSMFHPSVSGLDVPHRVVTVGRIGPSKRLELFIEASRRIAADRPGRDPVFEVYGGTLLEADREYEASLRTRVEQAGLSGRFRFLGPRAYSEIPNVFRGAACFVNCSVTNSVDKAVLEAMASGVPPVTSNASFRSILGPLARACWFQPGDVDGLTCRIGHVLDLPGERRARMSGELIRLVRQQHGIESFFLRLAALCRERSQHYRRRRRRCP